MAMIPYTSGYIPGYSSGYVDPYYQGYGGYSYGSSYGMMPPVYARGRRSTVQSVAEALLIGEQVQREMEYGEYCGYGYGDPYSSGFGYRGGRRRGRHGYGYGYGGQNVVYDYQNPYYSPRIY